MSAPSAEFTALATSACLRAGAYFIGVMKNVHGDNLIVFYYYARSLCGIDTDYGVVAVHGYNAEDLVRSGDALRDLIRDIVLKGGGQ